MVTLIEGTGIFIYPLGLCSILAVFIILERIWALRSQNVIPKALLPRFITGSVDATQGDSRSVAGRLIAFFHKNQSDREGLKAYAHWEVSHMGRGIFILEIIVSAAPLLGLLGTVTGLIRVFGNLATDTGLPNPEAMVEGISLALTTTMLGLSIAIPALAGTLCLNRRIDSWAAQIYMGVECLSHSLPNGQRNPARDITSETVNEFI